VSANDYSRGLAKANKSIKLLQRIFGKKSRKITEMNHDKADRKMYQAMGYGMYAHTGTKLNK